MSDVSLETARGLGLLPEEFEQIKNRLGRTPNFNELSIYSVMWSEHCSYKNSILWLKKLPKEGEMMLAKAGEENAGLVDIGEGLACCFKIESHNHPSAIEPYQGAATGVGGINRDIFSMGARPIAQLNSLRFGNIETARTRWLVKGVVKGIGDYGNSFGIPTVGGEVYFDDCYETNILVNAMSVGIVEVGKTISAVADGPGNPVYIFGSRTGKDGIHGAAFASKDISDESMADLPAVQVGDPFWEKLILEASMELRDAGVLVGMQDMGAAGITCSTSEMSAKSGTGMLIDLDKVPLRQDDMEAWEILLSESQERMLAVVHKGREAEAEAILNKWELIFSKIGEVTDTGRVVYLRHGKVAADVPAEHLVLGGGAPVYEREYVRPAYMDKNNAFSTNDVPVPPNLKKVAKFLAGLPNIASKRWIYSQYDSMVGTINQSTNRNTDAAVVHIRGTKRSLALTVDCNSRYVYADPQTGAAIAVAEAARNIVCSGGIPCAITNCLNFGNPYDIGVYWQFVHAILGMKEACEKLGTPVTGGNVSFYNQNSEDGTAVFPTPTIGMVGLIEKQEYITTFDFKDEGDIILLLGKEIVCLGSSQYVAHYHGIAYSMVPHLDLDDEVAVQKLTSELIRTGLVKSCHDLSEGGLFISLLESAMPRGLGVDIQSHQSERQDAWLFGEGQGRIVITVAEDDLAQVEAIIQNHSVNYRAIGEVCGNRMMIDNEDFGSVESYQLIYDEAIQKKLGLQTGTSSPVS